MRSSDVFYFSESRQHLLPVIRDTFLERRPRILRARRSAVRHQIVATKERLPQGVLVGMCDYSTSSGRPKEPDSNLPAPVNDGDGKNASSGRGAKMNVRTTCLMEMLYSSMINLLPNRCFVN
jgi:hypothetical protein